MPGNRDTISPQIQMNVIRVISPGLSNHTDFGSLSNTPVGRGIDTGEMSVPTLPSAAVVNLYNSSETR